MIAIIDYSTGNIHSVENALRRLGAEFTLTADPEIINSADHILLPGVGHAGEAIGRLRQSGLVETIRRLRKPLLGICVGMQVLCRHTEEGNVDGLGIFDAKIKRFVPSSPDDKIPHMGWPRLATRESKLFKDVAPGAGCYSGHA